ncbi:hypothetical protein GCM10010129_75000 [Streptomyces fumigatiscleroticus]|nr:hypothetical protein GCM10010129_75000 [Streptomyces fumigatiscleroticus]
MTPGAVAAGVPSLPAHSAHQRAWTRSSAMPVKITPDDAYDEESDTLRVGRHDLERLLLEFRALAAK